MTRKKIETYIAENIILKEKNKSLTKQNSNLKNFITSLNNKYKHPLANADTMLDVFYGGVIAFALFQFFESFNFVDVKSFHFKCIIYIITLVYFIDDYITVKMVNAKEPYYQSGRFAIDTLIVIVFFISFKLLSTKSIKYEFMFPVLLIYWLSTRWTKRLSKIGKKRDKEYLKYTKISNFTSYPMSVFLVISVSVFLFSKQDAFLIHINSLLFKDNVFYILFLVFFIFFHVILTVILKLRELKRLKDSLKNMKQLSMLIFITETGPFLQRPLMKFWLYIESKFSKKI